MRFNEETIAKIDKVLTDKKIQNPICGREIGLGIHLNEFNGSNVLYCDDVICNVENLKRVIEELTMLKESIEEVTGIIL